MHDRDPIRSLCQHREVVGHEDQPDALVVDEPAEEFENLGLRRDIQRRCRLVGDQELRLEDGRDGNRDALPLTARQAVRVAVERKLRSRQAGVLQRCFCKLPRFAPVHVLVYAHGLGDLVADRLHRVQRGHGFLEHDADVPAAHLAILSIVRSRQVLARDENLARQLRPVGQQSRDR